MTPEPDHRLLNDGERILLAIGGIFCISFSWIVWFNPGSRTQIAESAKSPPYTTDISADPTLLCVSCASAGVILLVLSANRLRLAHLKAGPYEARSMEAPKAAADRFFAQGAARPAATEPPIADKDDADSARVPKPEATIWVNGAELGLYRLSDIPSELLTDLVASEEWKTHGYATVDVEFVARRRGQGNHAWLFKFRNQDTLWKVARGGQGKSVITITPVPSS